MITRWSSGNQGRLSPKANNAISRTFHSLPPFPSPSFLPVYQLHFDWTCHSLSVFRTRLKTFLMAKATTPVTVDMAHLQHFSNLRHISDIHSFIHSFIPSLPFPFSPIALSITPSPFPQIQLGCLGSTVSSPIPPALQTHCDAYSLRV